MPNNQIRVSPKDKSRKVKQPNNSRASWIFDNKQDAINKAIEIAKNQHLEMVVQNLNWRIWIKNSYGNDPKSVDW